jgi:hypothetical protein
MLVKIKIKIKNVSSERDKARVKIKSLLYFDKESHRTAGFFLPLDLFKSLAS